LNFEILMDAFIKFLTAITPLSAASIEQIERVALRESFPKRHVLIPELATCEKLYFIEKGLVRAYFYHQGKEVTDWFGVENSMIGPVIRRFPTKESPHVVELLEESVVVSVSFAQLEHLYEQSHEIERLGRLIAIQTMVHVQQKLDNCQLLSAKQRYEQFLEDYPRLTQRVSLAHVASYLGMNQVTLSRIRHPH